MKIPLWLVSYHHIFGAVASLTMGATSYNVLILLLFLSINILLKGAGDATVAFNWLDMVLYWIEALFLWDIVTV